MLDVLIVGAGPAGSVAGTILARAGAGVRIVDRAGFPRDKLCGDTVNPGTLARLEALNLAAGIAERGLRIDGMRVTCERGVAVRGAIVSEQRGARSVSGAVLSAGGGESPLAARVTIAADGRHSTIAFGLRLAHHPPS